jgi:hypothetical protein
MADTNDPTLFSQLWAQVEPTILGEGASETERINARTAFLSGANAVPGGRSCAAAARPRWTR